jgi:cytochrome P450
MLLTNAVFDLAARPEYRDKLRGEANKVLNELGRKWNLESMNELKKMDSFLKESQRLNGTIIAFQRKAMKDLTLSDGTFIPAGTLFLAPAVAIATDESVYPGAESFDGLRYYKKRAASKQDENMHQLTSTSKTMLGFSTGRHACPGRWFASAESKMILAGLLLHYDFKLKEGEERPASLLSQGMRMPNPMAKIIFKKLSV